MGRVATDTRESHQDLWRLWNHSESSQLSTELGDLVGTPSKP